MVAFSEPVALAMDTVVPYSQRYRGRFSTVLLATDLSNISAGATTEAIQLCRSLRAKLLVVNVIDVRHGFANGLSPFNRGQRLDQVRSEREQQLIKVVEEARGLGVDASFLVWTGEPGQSIVSAAEAESADVIVLGTRALDRAGRFLLGSVSDYVVNNSPCPVLVARADSSRAATPREEREI
jgi:nucleotide-binding universal stress UspA family protein